MIPNKAVSNGEMSLNISLLLAARFLEEKVLTKRQTNKQKCARIVKTEGIKRKSMKLEDYTCVLPSSVSLWAGYYLQFHITKGKGRNNNNPHGRWDLRV